MQGLNIDNWKLIIQVSIGQVCMHVKWWSDDWLPLITLTPSMCLHSMMPLAVYSGIHVVYLLYFLYCFQQHPSCYYLVRTGKAWLRLTRKSAQPPAHVRFRFCFRVVFVLSFQGVNNNFMKLLKRQFDTLYCKYTTKSLHANVQYICIVCVVCACSMRLPACMEWRRK